MKSRPVFNNFSYLRPLVVFFTVFAAFTSAVYFGQFIGWWPSFVLASLIVFSFFVSFGELVLGITTGILIQNWQPMFSYETLIFFAIPLSFYFLRRFAVRRDGWFGSTAAVSIAVLIFYLIQTPFFLTQHALHALADIFLSALFGILLFVMFCYVYKEKLAF